MQKYIISHTTTIKDALVALNEITSDAQSLLVIDDTQRLVGTLTDGDIRRGLISGAELSDVVSTIMHQDFKYVL
jgi:CBS domain-containing protein